MLTEKSSIVAINDVVTVKLLSGEEIVGRLTKLGEGSITLAKPVLITLQPMNQTQMGLAFQPVLGSVEPDTTLTIAETSIAIKPVKTGKQVLGNYIEMTSSIIPANVNANTILRS